MPLYLAFVLILVDEYWLSDQWSIQNSNNNLHLCSLLVKTLAYFAIEQGPHWQEHYSLFGYLYCFPEHALYIYLMTTSLGHLV